MIAGGITFDYPETGPQDIYDLGVPRDAKIVNNMPASDSLSILERYREIRDDATKEYVAVVAHNTAVNISDAVNQLDVDYKSGREERLEHHEVFSRGEAFVELSPQVQRTTWRLLRIPVGVEPGSL